MQIILTLFGLIFLGLYGAVLQLTSVLKYLNSKNRNLQQQLDNRQDTKVELVSNESTVDHSFAKRVADEIVRMTTNLSRMDESVKGFKQIKASVRKLEQSLNSNQYELEDLLNKPYDSGMNIQATIVEDDNFKVGEAIITRIIKPQINYNGKLIQAAQVEVSQGV